MNALLTILWGTRTAKTVTLVGGSIAAVFGAITAAHTAWPFVDPYVPAHRGYVVEKVGDVQTTTNELLRWKFEDTRSRLQSEYDGWTIQLQKEQEPQTRSLIESRIKQLDKDKKQIDERIEKLPGK